MKGALREAGRCLICRLVIGDRLRASEVPALSLSNCLSPACV
jgi:hypothetical protein